MRLAAAVALSPKLLSFRISITSIFESCPCWYWNGINPCLFKSCCSYRRNAIWGPMPAQFFGFYGDFRMFFQKVFDMNLVCDLAGAFYLSDGFLVWI